MVENPWRALLPHEPVFSFATAAPPPTALDAMDFADRPPMDMLPSPSPEQLPSPSQQLLMPAEQELNRLHSTAAELEELLHAVHDPACAKSLYPVVLQTLARARSIIETHQTAQVHAPTVPVREPEPGDAIAEAATEQSLDEEPQPPKRSRLTLPPPVFEVPAHNAGADPHCR